MTTNHHATPTTLWGELRDELRLRRQARAARRALEAELASYSTPSEVDDLLAAADGIDSADADQVRSILSHNLMRRATSLHAA